VPREGKNGLLEQCKGGTIFIDELAWLSREMQAFLLTILDGANVQKVGELTAGYKPDARFIFATNRNPLEEVARGNILHDFWRRLSPYTVTIPPLRERKEDIPFLVRALLDETKIEPGAILALMLYDWPGNVAELDAILKKAPREKGLKIDLDDLEVPDDPILKVRALGAEEVGRTLINLLIAPLKERGFVLGKGLNAELARLLGMSKAKVSSLLKQAGK
jgi:transcriptional regulator with PAS, ATPase and Fis domain